MFTTRFTLPDNPYPAKLIYLNFQPLEGVSRYRVPQLSGWKLVIFVKFEQKYLHLLMFSTHFIANNSDLVDYNTD